MNFEPIRFILERMYDLIKYEAGILLVDEKKEVQSLQRDLELIESYLKDIDEIERQATLNHVLQTKVQHLIQILPDIDNFLDTITDQTTHEQIQPSCFKKLKAFFSCASNPLIRKHQFTEEITRIRESLCHTLQRPGDYQLPNNYTQVINKRRRLPTNPGIIKDEIIIGLKEDVSTLVVKFVGEHGKSGANTAIVGMGGSGKTTLAKMFYNHKVVKEAFPRRAWVCVSQEWNTNDLLLQICAMLGIRLSEDERSIAGVKLQQFLEGISSCLVVLDDVWEIEALQELLPILLSGNGRVLITTRNESIVKFPRIPAFHIHKARRLAPEECWELFSRIVSNTCEGAINFEDEHFVKIGKEMLGKCDGLPLAIIALAGLLGTKVTIQQWENIKDDVISRIMGDDNGSLDYGPVKKVLELSYFDLPYYLKPCFLYLGTFKEDEEIQAHLLINLWIDEGFVKPDHCPDNRRLTEVSKDFLEELAQRCMVQVVSRDYEGDVKDIRIHDLMRDLCISKAKELDFFQVISPSATSSATSPVRIEPPYRRAIIHNRNSFILANPRLRTLIFMGEHKYKPKQLHSDLFPFRMLTQVRVLFLKGVVLGESAKEIGNMVLLRYLRFQDCTFEIRNVDFFKNLRNLRSLIFNPVIFGRIEKLLDNMVSSMEELRVLHLWDIKFSKLGNTILGVDKLRKLQSLHSHAGEWLVRELQTTSIDLRELVVYDIHSQPHLDAIYGFITNNPTHLEILLLHLGSGLGFDLQKMALGRCLSLKYLFLNGKIIKQEGGEPWLLFPPRLLSMTLLSSGIERQDDMNEAIAQLNHLRELYLYNGSYEGDKLTITGLSQLQNLHLNPLYNLKECRITQGSLTQLRELSINGCRKLERIPNGISDIRTLQLLTISFMPREFCRRLEKKEEGGSNGGEDFHLVQHIPTITFTDDWSKNLRSKQMFRYF